MEKIYLDMNIYNRPFDDQSQVRIRMETIAIYEILDKIKTGEYSLVWSFILDYENSLNPYDEIKIEVKKLSNLASENVIPSDIIRIMAKGYEQRGIKPRDALHLACAVQNETDCFLTCDDKFFKKIKLLKVKLEVCNPIDFILKGDDRHGTN